MPFKAKPKHVPFSMLDILNRPREEAGSDIADGAANRLSRQTTVPPIQPKYVPNSMWDILKRPREEARPPLSNISYLELTSSRAVKRLSGQTIGPTIQNEYDAIQKSPTNSETSKSTRASTPLSDT